MTISTKLPLFSEDIYRYSVVLAGQVRYLRFYYNQRTSSWHVDIENEGHHTVIKGLALVADYPMMQDYSITGWDGYLYLFPKSNAHLINLKDSKFTIAEHYELYHVYVPERYLE